jgi:hypothetical protein
MITETPIYDELKSEFDYLRESCEHGLSLWLCAGPGHYPPDDPFRDFMF